MSKSKGNVVTPTDVLDEHGADAVRYWAANGQPGTDTAIDDNQFRIGRRLAIKLLNASRFVLGVAGEEAVGEVSHPADRSMLARLADSIEVATDHLEAFEYADALEVIERFFWWFCDYHIELVKTRAYGDDGQSDPATASARTALRLALSAQLRLFAPYLPFVTEEVWSWTWEGSIHRQAWPQSSELPVDGADGEIAQLATEVLDEVRRIKSQAGVSLGTEMSDLEVTIPSTRLDVARSALDDLRDASVAPEIRLAEGDELAVEGTVLIE